MAPSIRVAIIQADLVWENKPANLALFEARIKEVDNSADLIVLPEMFSTGFSMNAQLLAEEMDGPTVSWLSQMAASSGSTITGSAIIKEEHHFYNRLIWMRPDGSYDTYDKRHLFTFAEEHHSYTAGREHLVVDFMGWKVLPLICYDLRFPVWSRNTQDYDLLLYVANFPEKRRYAWQQLLTARAIENQVYTIGLNRVGTDGKDIAYAGDSTIFDYAGRSLSSSAYIESIQYATLSYEAQQAFRSRFAFLPDRDRFNFDL